MLDKNCSVRYSKVYVSAALDCTEDRHQSGDLVQGNSRDMGQMVYDYKIVAKRVRMHDCKRVRVKG